MIKNLKSTLESRIARLEKLIKNEASRGPSLTSLKRMTKLYFDQNIKDDAELVHTLTWSVGDQRNIVADMLRANGFNENEVDDILYHLGSDLEDLLEDLANKREEETPNDDAIKSWMESYKTSDVKKALAMGADPNGVNGDGRPLEVQANHGNKTAVRLLLNAGADVNLGDPVFAAADYHSDVLRLLIKAGADVNKVKTSFKMTPLDRAIAVDCEECEQILIDAGAKTKSRKVKRGMWARDDRQNG